MMSITSWLDPTTPHKIEYISIANYNLRQSYNLDELTLLEAASGSMVQISNFKMI